MAHYETGIDDHISDSQQAADSFISKYADFIVKSPSSYHAVEESAQLLAVAGYVQQDEHETWQCHQRGFVRRSGAILAWRLPRKVTPDVGFRIVGSHTDSPSFKVKPNPDSFQHGFSQVNVEVYGGPLLNSWLNRDLGLAGQVATIDGEVHLVKTPPLMVIPQLAPHLDRSVNTHLELSAQRDYHPIWAIGENSMFEQVAACADLDAERIAGMDLYAYDAAAPAIYGGQGSDFFAAGRQDNLSSVYASLQAFLATDDSECDDVQIMVAFDHEEVGSTTFTGACGPFLEAMLRRLHAGLDAPVAQGEEGFQRMLANSSCISADAGHSINPNKPEKHDPDHHPVLGSGPLLKINGNQRYATEAEGKALWLRACDYAGVACQEFVSNNDVPCGTTIGPLTTQRLGIITVDVGIPLLSMHSVREISSPTDLIDLSRVLEGYFHGA
ncbi:aspartyl aminopeptidase [Arcanobacterium pluranimalium]|uniref:M18 family aminopeptidase n=1 Tax=Arcanobacterium pluranimalium TaxID=108028 RepID=UPI00195C2650|nr:M18 family aminopeptidase [Arcanobacterium pluranimalium]MBM7824845.1 aspartyl aminopeptidase [Arcanobacterium pluranimalium]